MTTPPTGIHRKYQCLPQLTRFFFLSPCLYPPVAPVCCIEQSGSSTATTADWSGENKDTIDTIGFGIKHTIIEKRLDVGGDFSLTNSQGRVTVDAGSAAAPFPDINADFISAKLYAAYKLRDNLTLKGTYWYQKLDSTNWSYDGVAVDTVSNLLALGQTSPNYSVNVVMMSLRYQF